MTESILNTVKLSLPMDPSYAAFDNTLLMHINTAINIMYQIGVDDGDSFNVVDETTTWDELTGSVDNLQMAKTYICMKVKMLFDPPAASSANEAMKSAISELEWRINYQVDGGGDS